MLRGFHPCHVGTLDFCSVSRWIFWLNFLEAVFRWHLLFLLQKNTHQKFGEKFGEKIRWKHSVFRCVLRCVLRYAFRCVFRWATFCLEIGKIRAESVLQERPLNNFCRYDYEIRRNFCFEARSAFGIVSLCQFQERSSHLISPKLQSTCKACLAGWICDSHDQNAAILVHIATHLIELLALLGVSETGRCWNSVSAFFLDSLQYRKLAIFRVIFWFSGYFNLWRLSPKNNL